MMHCADWLVIVAITIATWCTLFVQSVATTGGDLVFPSHALTALSTTFSSEYYDAGTYEVSGSSSFVGVSYPAYYAFDRDVATYYHTYEPIYSTGSYSGSVYTTATDGNNYYGEYLQIKMPCTIRLTAMKMRGRDGLESYRMPRTMYLLGSSNAGSTWTLIESWSGLTDWSTNTRTLNLTSNSVYYSSYRMVAYEIGVSGNSLGASLNVAEWLLVGDTYDPTAAPTIAPSATPTAVPSASPSVIPTSSPSFVSSKYPPAAMTSTSTSMSSSYGSGTYVSSASSINNLYQAYYSYYAFDRDNSTFYMSGDYYDTTTGIYSGSSSTTASNGVTYQGEYLQLTMPVSIYLSSFKVLPRQLLPYGLLRVPRTFVVLGSADSGSTWQLLYQDTDVTSWSISSYNSFYISSISNTAYSLYRMIPSRIGIYDSSTDQLAFTIAEWELYGYEWNPTATPTVAPTIPPSVAPSMSPTGSPSVSSTVCPSIAPTVVPSIFPTQNPTTVPSVFPTVPPTTSPTTAPTVVPSLTPSWNPTTAPSLTPTYAPSIAPTVGPSYSASPTEGPTSSIGGDLVFPSRALSGSSTTFTFDYYDAGTYVVSGSSSFTYASYPAYYAFDRDVNTYYHTFEPTYSGGSYTGSVSTTAGGSSYLGEYLQIQMPTTIRLTALKMRGRGNLETSRSPRKMYVFGSSDSGSTWTLTETFSGLTDWTTETRTLNMSSNAYYFSTYRFVVNEVGTSGDSNAVSFNIAECLLVGDTYNPTAAPTTSPPSALPSIAPSTAPTLTPTTATPTIVPSLSPIESPTVVPSVIPTVIPSIVPTIEPTTSAPSFLPTLVPSETPTRVPTVVPTVIPSFLPSLSPSNSPTIIPSSIPTCTLTFQPSVYFPTSRPTIKPTDHSLSLYIVTQTVNSMSIVLTVRFSVMSNLPGTLYCNAVQTKKLASIADYTSTAFDGQSISYLANAEKINITVTGLDAVQAYYIFCGAQSSAGIRSSEDDIANSVIRVTTACCRMISFTSSVSYLFTDSQYYLSLDNAGKNSFSIALSSSPENDLTVVPVLQSLIDDSVLPSKNVTIAPSQLGFSANGSVLSGSFSIFPTNFAITNSTQYILRLVVNGTDTWKYNITAGVIVTMVPSTSVPPVPSLSSVQFSDNGNGFYVYFDGSTNYGGIDSTLNYWSCSTLLSFDSIDAASCSWLNKTTIFVMLSSTSTLSVGDSVTIKGGLITAECVSSASCMSYPSIPETTQTIASPMNPLSPYVILSSASSYSSCSDVVIDASASSGNGGREWENIVWHVYNSNGTMVDEVIEYLTTYHAYTYNLSNIAIPMMMFEEDTYYISLTLTNFLEMSSSTTVSFQYGVNPNVPMIKIGGPSIITTKVSATLSLYGTATVSSCTNTSLVSYQWLVQDITSTTDISQGGIIVSGLKSSSKNPMTFILSGYQLISGRRYMVTFAAISDILQSTMPGSNGYNSTTSVIVVVNSGSIYAVIKGSSVRYISQSATLDAKSSYDEDTLTPTLLYQWSCKIGNGL